MDALILVAVSMLAAAVLWLLVALADALGRADDREIDELTLDAIETLRQIIERESARNDAEIRRLRDALLDYGNHKHDFSALSEQTCTCGFSAALWG